MLEVEIPELDPGAEQRGERALDAAFVEAGRREQAGLGED
jgi:hypothetical protein